MPEHKSPASPGASSSGYLTYINAAFGSSREDEVFLFVGMRYIVFNFVTGKVVDRPQYIFQGFPIAGIHFSPLDCALGSVDGNKVFFFDDVAGCARIEYDPENKKPDVILQKEFWYSNVFPCLKDTVFERMVDAAFLSHKNGEAYVFESKQYALIDYREGQTRLLEHGPIIHRFPCLKGTIFADGFDAAFSNQKKNGAYLFKHNSFVQMELVPETMKYSVVGGVKKILEEWPSLRCILPNNGRFDRPNIRVEKEFLPGYEGNIYDPKELHHGPPFKVTKICLLD